MIKIFVKDTMKIRYVVEKWAYLKIGLFAMVL